MASSRLRHRVAGRSPSRARVPGRRMARRSWSPSNGYAPRRCADHPLSSTRSRRRVKNSLGARVRLASTTSLTAVGVTIALVVTQNGSSSSGAPTNAAAQERAAPGEVILSDAGRRSDERVSRGGSRPLAEERLSPLVRRPAKKVPSRQVKLPTWLQACRTQTQKLPGANGQVADGDLCELPKDGFHLRGDAAKAWWKLTGRYEERFGEPPCLTDAYRSLAAQQRLYASKPGLAARPGTSNHGWGVAVDLCGGAQSFGTPEHEWLSANAEKVGWTHPAWARRSGSKPEPWHWEFTGGMAEG